MTKVIDLEADLPLAEDGTLRHADWVPLTTAARVGPERTEELEGYGFSNYGTIFSSRDAEEPARESMTSYVARMDAAGIRRGVMRAQSNQQTAEIMREHPDRFIGLAFVNPLDGMRAVRELERAVVEDSFGALAVSALYSGLPAGDRRFYPLYAKCVELDIPVRIYTAMSYANDRPYDLGHPRNIDQVAVDFPELRIVAGLGGWPWASDMAALLRRHPNLYADTSAHRPKYIGRAGSGWEQFLHFGNSVNQDKIMVGLSATLMGAPFETLIDEYDTLELKESVKRKWLYENAVRFFRLD